ncbi:MAG: T9SS type A sorting domain-containing protein [Bacteroidetes bacterium]|nr:T9SS type A sorting domain-containing protein [Bacteroidota bacterium]
MAGIGGNNIIDTLYADHQKITYKYSWGMYPMDLQERYWTFNVYNDCSVEFVESFGDEITWLSATIPDKRSLFLYPNPFKAFIELDSGLDLFNFEIYNTTGIQVHKGRISDSMISNLNHLNPGVYILKVFNGGQIFVERIIKK